ncbi:hypothetical protein ACV1C4_21010 [Aeromonas hydrophila]
MVETEDQLMEKFLRMHRQQEEAASRNNIIKKPRMRGFLTFGAHGT